MSTQAVQWAFMDAPMLTTEKGHHDSTSRFILAALAEKARGEPPTAFATPATLALMTGLDRVVIRRGLGRLAEAGLISAVGSLPKCKKWRLELSRKRPASDLEELEREVTAERERERDRKRRARLSGTQNAGQGRHVRHAECRTGENLSGTQSAGHGELSGTLSPDVRHAECRTHSALSLLNRKDEPKDPPHIPPRPLPAEDGLLPLAALAETDAASRQAPTGAGPDTAVAFAAFWAVYPRRVGKLGAERKFQKALKEGTDPADIIAGAERYAEMRAGQDPKFTKHPGTWLNQGCWEDEPDPESRGLTLVQGHRPFKNPDDQSVYYEEF